MGEPVVLERHFAHSPARVFEAWTEVELLCRWFGCGVDMLWDIHEWDVRVGGRLRVSLDYDGTPFVVEGEFLVIEPPRHLKYRWGEETVDVAISAYGEGCLVVLRHDGIATDELGRILTGGLTRSFEQLEGILDGLHAREAL